MFELHAEKAALTLLRREPVTSGSMNMYTARFTFSKEWEGLEKTAFFKAGTVCREVPLNDAGECAVPPAVLQRCGTRLRAGVRGIRDGETILPTVWADLGLILESAAGGQEEGVVDHRFLSHREDEDQHPISAIEGLAEELAKIPAPVEPMTNEELEEILK